MSRGSPVSARFTVPDRPPKPQALGRVGPSKTHPVPCIAVKLGSCPVEQLRCLSPIKHMCNQDSDCSGRKRCCASACGRDCRDPSKGAVPASPPAPAPGCPSSSTVPAASLRSKSSQHVATAGDVGCKGSHQCGRDTGLRTSCAAEATSLSHPEHQFALLKEARES